MDTGDLCVVGGRGGGIGHGPCMHSTQKGTRMSRGGMWLLGARGQTCVGAWLPSHPGALL